MISGAVLAGWMIGAGYLVGFAAITALLAQRTSQKIWLFDQGGQAWSAWGFRLAFAVLLLWPLVGGRENSSAIWLVVAAAGGLFGLWAQAHMGRSWRIGAAAGKVGALVTDGPFRWSRNPVFLGLIVLFWMLVPVGGWVMLAGAVLMTLSAIFQVRTEEAILKQDPSWNSYTKTVPRWIGPL